jgi:hypothetical protein
VVAPARVMTGRVKGVGSYTLSLGDQSFDGSGTYAPAGDARLYVTWGVEDDRFQGVTRRAPVKTSPVPAPMFE